MPPIKPTHVIPALRVRQWLAAWNSVRWNAKASQSEPEPSFLMFTIPAERLRSLAGIYRRSATTGQARAADLNVQRQHEVERSTQIRDFIEYGYPWCELSDQRRKDPKFSNLRKPGWLPTAIVVNILRAGDERDGVKLLREDAIQVDEHGPFGLQLRLPSLGTDWKPKSIPPIEVIDGQHRLFAFDSKLPGDFDLPVVAFHGLDRSWQAYLFWSINITPKRIKQSLAFDLYPLLRTEDWLERFDGHPIYRETRAQELVESLWAHPRSPWCGRINMLGESGHGAMVSQAAWIRSLMATYVKPWEGPGDLGGLFGSRRKGDGGVLPWNRAQQAAFLILVGEALREAVRKTKSSWAVAIRKHEDEPQKKILPDDDIDPAFYSRYSLLSTDQGIRGVLAVSNDLVCMQSTNLELEAIRTTAAGAATDEELVSSALKRLQKSPVSTFVSQVAEHLANYDWRASSLPDLPEEQRRKQLVFRGSSGYREMRRQLLEHLSAGKDAVATTAKAAAKALGYHK